MTIRYTKEHEWVRVDGDTATVGITDYAQEQLGDAPYWRSAFPVPASCTTR